MEPNIDPPNDLSDDILEGADAIAEFWFGSKESRRKVCYLAECSKLPIFRLGSVRSAPVNRAAQIHHGAGEQGVSVKAVTSAATICHHKASPSRIDVFANSRFCVLFRNNVDGNAGHRRRKSHWFSYNQVDWRNPN
jgi:hypothetical protein